MAKPKILVSFLITGSVLFSMHAMAGVLADRADAISENLRAIENDLSVFEEREVRMALRRLEMVVGTSPIEPAPSFICVSNGEFGGFEKFAIHDLTSGKTIGGYTEKSTCNQLIVRQANSMICTSNGELGGFEKFKVYDLKSQKSLGGGTELSTCSELISKASRDLLCVSNGELGGFEKFHLVNRRNGSAVGSGTSLSNCLESVR